MIRYLHEMVQKLFTTVNFIGKIKKLIFKKYSVSNKHMCYTDMLVITN